MEQDTVTIRLSPEQVAWLQEEVGITSRERITAP